MLQETEAHGRKATTLYSALGGNNLCMRVLGKLCEIRSLLPLRF
jgi:hypothetical protein